MPSDTLPLKSLKDLRPPPPGQLATCFAFLADGRIHLGNELYSEVWAIGGGNIRCVSFQTGKTGEWFQPSANKEPSEEWTQAFTTDFEESPLHEGQAMIVHLTLTRHEKVRAFTWKLFERLPGSLLQISCEESFDEIPRESKITADGIEETDNESPIAPLSASCLGVSVLARRHLTITEVQFIEQSDIHADFVFCKTVQLHPSERLLQYQTNFIYWEDPATGDGLVFILLAPSRLVRADWSPPFDFRMTSSRGSSRREYHWDAYPGHYPLVSLGYTGGEFGRVQVTSLLQRVLHNFSPTLDGLLLSNTWGDRSRANRLNAGFVSLEIEAAAKLGVEVVQIDDGWQQGRSANTTTDGVWNGFWQTDPHFWQVDTTRFPNGLAPLQAQAHARGLSLGLWYAPDSFDEFKNWQRDADTILDLWRRYSIRHFKLDAIKLTSRLAESRLDLMLERLQTTSNGSILVDLDATAESRPTYWGQTSGTVIFLQNRYTDTGSYYPHQTLRALWSLAPYILPTRLRLEFLNPIRNQETYGDDPLRPSAYPVETLFAITMPASPLAWLENSGLDRSTLEAWQPLISIWKQHRHQWSAGVVLPIGNQPDGWNWTGFVSIAENTLTGYALIFRQLNPSATWHAKLPRINDSNLTCRILAGEGHADYFNGQINITIPSLQQFLFIKIETHRNEEISTPKKMCETGLLFTRPLKP